MEAVFGQEVGEDGPHLLEAEGDFAAFLLAGVCNYGEMRRVNFEPGRFGSRSERDRKDHREEAYAERDRTESRHSRRVEGFKEMLPRPAKVLLKIPGAEGPVEAVPPKSGSYEDSSVVTLSTIAEICFLILFQNRK